MHARLTRFATVLVGAGAVVVAGAGVGVAVAAEQFTGVDSNGVIHGCFNKSNGSLRVIDSTQVNCNASSEQSLDWNQAGTNTSGAVEEHIAIPGSYGGGGCGDSSWVPEPTFTCPGTPPTADNPFGSVNIESTKYPAGSFLHVDADILIGALGYSNVASSTGCVRLFDVTTASVVGAPACVTSTNQDTDSGFRLSTVPMPLPGGTHDYIVEFQFGPAVVSQGAQVVVRSS